MLKLTLSWGDWAESSPQPVILTQENKIKYYNSAAVNVFREAGRTLEEDCALPEEFPAETVDGMELPFGNHRWMVRCQETEQGLLYTLTLLAETENALLHQVSANLRNLLGPLSLSLELLQKDMKEGEVTEQKERWLNTMNRSQYQLTRLADHLELMGMEDDMAALVYPPRLIDLAGLCRDIERYLQPLAQEAGYTFAYQDTIASLLVPINEELARLLVYNLTANAFRANGNVTMSLKKGRGKAVLTVEDDGDGISNSALSKAFDLGAFSLSDSVRNGVGLGLPLCRKIAAMTGGTLLINRKKKGTRITVNLPVGGPSRSLRAPSPLSGRLIAHQLLCELSGVLPSECYGKNDIFE